MPCNCFKMQVLCSDMRCSCRKNNLKCNEFCHKGEDINHERCPSFQPSSYHPSLYNKKVEDDMVASLNGLSLNNSLKVYKKKESKKQVSFNKNLMKDQYENDANEEQQDALTFIFAQLQNSTYTRINEDLISQKKILKNRIKDLQSIILPFFINQEIDNKGKSIIEGHNIPNLKSVKTGDDGNCLFYAVSICLLGNNSIADELRLLSAYTFLKYKPIFIENIIKRGITGSETYFQDLVLRTVKNKSWGCDLVIQALSIVTDRPIIVLNIYKNNSFFSNLNESSEFPLIITHFINHYAGTIKLKDRNVELKCPDYCIDSRLDENSTAESD